jgi:hypothetical protein
MEFLFYAEVLEHQCVRPGTLVSEFFYDVTVLEQIKINK